MIVIVVSNTIKCFFFVLPDNTQSHSLAHTHMERAETKGLLLTRSPTRSSTHTDTRTHAHTQTHWHQYTHKDRQHLMLKLLHTDMKWLTEMSCDSYSPRHTHTHSDGHTHTQTHTHFLALVSKFLSATSWRVIYPLAQLFNPPAPHQDPKPFLPLPPTKSRTYTWAGSHTVL